MSDLARDAIREVLLGGPPLRLALLFGSAARGELRAGSDIDIAILPADPGLALSAELDLQVSLETAAGRPVDLVRLDDAPTLLKWHIAREGSVLFEASPFAAARFVASAASEYLDFEPSFKRAAESFRRRLAGRHGSRSP